MHMMREGLAIVETTGVLGGAKAGSLTMVTIPAEVSGTGGVAPTTLRARDSGHKKTSAQTPGDTSTTAERNDIDCMRAIGMSDSDWGVACWLGTEAW